MGSKKTNSKKINYKKIIKTTLHVIFLFILSLVITAALFSKIEFPNETVEEYYFYYTNGMGSSDTSNLVFAIQGYWWKFLLTFIAFIAIFYNILGKKEIKNKKGKVIYPFNVVREHRAIYTTFLAITILILGIYDIQGWSYIYNNIATTKIYDEEYVQGTSDNIHFDGDKKNVVMIYVESLETTFIDKANGGDWDYNILEELTELSNEDDAIYFASDDNRLGEMNLYGSSWTTASIIANSSGMPFKIPLQNNEFTTTNFLNQFYTIGDVLKDNGYHNEVISAATTDFGGLKQFFTKHGEYEIIDSSTIDNYDEYELNEETEGAWGINDKYMFEIAKDRITKLASSGQNFNETIIGVDSHPANGDKRSYTVDKFDSQYENVYATDSALVYDFVKWLQEQDYYKDTVIIITGDHLCMQSSVTAGHKTEDRGRFNLIINSSVTTDNTKNRKFTAVDMYPTVLASAGATIDGDQIGLGVNLFSDKETLSEKYGFDYFNKELAKKSKFYKKVKRGE